MKRFSFSILIAGMLLVSLLGSCKKDNTGNYKVVFKASVQQPNEGSKTSIQPDGNNGNVLWSAGDAIKVYNGSTQSDFTLINGAGSQSASFGGDIAEADTYYAAYPASKATFSNSGDNKVVTFTLPTTQQVGTSANDFDKNAALMVAASNTQSFGFKNVFGILALKMKSANGISHVTKFELTAKNNVKIWDGTCSVTLNDDNHFVWNDNCLDNGSSSITLTCGDEDGVELTEEATTFYILVPPVEMSSGLELKIYNGDDEIYSLETTNPVTIGSNQGATFQHEGQPLVIEPTEPDPAIDPYSVPLTLEVLTDGTIKVNNPQSGMQYSKNGGDKTELTATTTIDVVANDKVAFYGNGTNITSYNGTRIYGGTAQVKAYGNIMSLVNETNYTSADVLTDNKAFAALFKENATLTDASGLLLPATTLTQECYSEMFRSCTALNAVPNLPAAVLPQQCYAHMFRQSGLVTVPADMMINATTMSNESCVSMFRECPNLTNAPTIAATTVGEYSCNAMFYHSANVASANFTLPATTLAYRCYYNMFNGCTQLTSVPSDMLPAETLANNCYEIMFKGCTNLTAAPELPAETLAEGCYANMFHGCTNLSSVTCMATDISADMCTEGWLNGVAATGTFTKASGANWTLNSPSGIPTGWTVNEQ